jgi:signal transduction histidine kinase
MAGQKGGASQAEEPSAAHSARPVTEDGHRFSLLHASDVSHTNASLEALFDQLPFCIQVHAMEEGFPVRYRNRRDEQRLRMLDPDQAAARDPRLRSLAERVAATGEPGHVEITVRDRSGGRLDWDWSISSLLDARGQVVGLVSVVENITTPVVARRRMESAVGLGMQLLLDIAQLAEAHDQTDELLSSVGGRLAELIKADRVAFYEYDAEGKRLRARTVEASGGASSVPPALPCDPDAADLAAQVVFGGRIYRGTVDISNLELWQYGQDTELARDEGARIVFVPWRAGTQQIGMVLAERLRTAAGFTQEEGTMLMAAGHAAGLVVQRKRAEWSLAERARELESLEQAKSHFLRLASHELRAPVALLNGYLSMLFEDDLPAEHQSDVRRILLQALDRMNLLLGQLVDATRLQESRLQLDSREVDVRDLVRRAADHVLPLLEPEREKDFELRLPDVPVPVVVDALRIEMVVQNLLDNAFKYSVAGDRVECRLEVDGSSVRVTVRDEGIGISEEEQATLFTRFGRAVNDRNSHVRGTGLGLFISREIARMHGGEVSLTSARDRGSRFELVLPTPA